jgi:hypothetical protein
MLDLINAVTALGTLVLLAATAIAGFIQLRHMRAGNELAAAQAIERDFRAPELQAALTYVQHEFAARIADAAYRCELAAPGYVDPRAHPEMLLCNWFNRTGTLVADGLLKEDLFMDSFGRLVIYYWELLVPAIAVLRRARGANQYAGFEYLVYRAGRRARRRPAPGPASASAAIRDPWLEEDRPATS